MEARDVLDVLALAEEAGVARLWIDGGWGIDALLGAQHRDHGDLDLVLPLGDLDGLVGVLGEVSFAVTLDERPARVVLTDPHGRVVDLHPVTFDDDGTAHPAGPDDEADGTSYPADEFTWGWVAGQRVPCLGPEVQLANHTGYEPTDRDREDVVRLHERFTLPLPDAYR